MVKDSKKYASTGGWGFQAWAGGDPTMPIVNGPTKQCYHCRASKKSNDSVFSTYLHLGTKNMMKSIPSWLRMTAAVFALPLFATSAAVSAQDKYALRVPGGLAFSEFRGYEGWSVISVSENKGLMAVILGNPIMINALKSGIPDNGKPFPDGARMAKIHWNPKKNAMEPGQPIQPDTLHDVDFMVKDGKRFSDSGGWGWAAFEYDAKSGAFRAGTLTDAPPQGNDAKCGFACHTAAKSHDYVFTPYPKR